MDKAKEAVQDILKICTALETQRPPANAASILISAVNTIDLYLTGKDKRNAATELMDKEHAAALIEHNSFDWIVYLSNGGYSRLVISPYQEPNKMWLTGGPHDGYEEVLSKWREIHSEH